MTGTEFDQESPESSPWTLRQRIAMLLWEVSWALFCRWTPKPLNRWRLMWLKLFGCKIIGTPFVHQRARIAIPWNLELQHRACLGDGANAYCLGRIIVGEHATVAQEAYLCTGTHAFHRPSQNLIVEEIEIGARAFVAARAFILPGIRVGNGAIVGACAVVTRDVPDNGIVAGNPARIIKKKRVLPLVASAVSTDEEPLNEHLTS